ncbi:TIGR04076 family protein [Patescibacteria group bacterium]|nr:TIGR04076 family protein [Patescibacteria group bacterium]
MKDYYNYNFEEPEVCVRVIESRGNCYKVGQEWKFGFHEIPKDFCSLAYSALLPYISAVAFGGKIPWEKKAGYATACCSDHANLVIFEIEKIK